jgi:hypothetical protein
VTPAELRRLAAELDARGKRLLDSGKASEAAAAFVQAETYEAAAAEMERLVRSRGLPSGNNPRMISGEKVTAAQLKRRGAAVARGRAAKGGRPVAIAITSSEWGNITRYAKERLRISQPALSRYIRGSLPCPRFVADAVKADFGLDYRVWSKVVD